MPSASPREIAFWVDGFPPAKNEALSMLGERHGHAQRVRSLLERAREAVERDGFQPFESETIGLEVVVAAPQGQDPWDATNYLGGIGDVLEEKSRRGTAIKHLEALLSVHLYQNDRQIKQVFYRQISGSAPRYSVRIWLLDSGEHE